ncbi:MAG TPA: HAD-IC family P-type ATPase [Dehalococcoidia bacterium]|nr:HAD-IC family P-type ATPase [Dehalococcoidia bacterium]
MRRRKRRAGAVTREAGHPASAWHALTREAVEEALGTGPTGLSSAEAAARLRIHGPNRLELAPSKSPLLVLVHQFQSPLIYILLVAAVITVVLGEHVDAGVIAAALALNAVVGFSQEWQAERSVQALMRLVAPRARVVRDGHEQEMDSEELVPGDLVLLESGSRVPADLRLVEAVALAVDESLLTGESVPVAKRSAPLPQGTPMMERTNMAYAGTVVTSGRGRGYVVATGEGTELGAIAAQIQRQEEPETPLQRRMALLARSLGLIVAVFAALTFVLGILLGESVTEMFLLAVAIAVAAIPEGLPVVFTITLAVGVRRMARRRAVVRHLGSVETLGSTTTIGSDKTGTLTENRMTVQQVWTAQGTWSPSEAPAAPMEEGTPLFLTLLAGVLTNEAQVYVTEDGPEFQGDPTEAALLVSAMRAGLDPQQLRQEYASLADIPFEPERRYSASVRARNDRYYLFVKGAPERVLAMCSHTVTLGGAVPVDHRLVLRAAEAMAGDGLRVLAMAYRPLPGPPPDPEHLPEPGGLHFLGLQGMLDPPRPGVREAIAGCHRAGIRVLMVTGDHAQTARAIAERLGIATAGAPVLTGVDLDRMDDGDLREAVREVSVFARVAPEHKLRIVRALQSLGEVVAITGDGVNDAPALKAADVGVAMGLSGTDVARQAADIVLADDNFVSIYAAVEEGRITFDNLRKATFYLLSVGLAGIVALLASLVLRWPPILLPAQILWLNMVVDGFQDVAMGFEPGEKDVLDRPPRRPGEGVVSRVLWERIVISALVMAAGALLMFRWELDESGSLERARTAALTTLGIFSAFHVGNARSERGSAFSRSPFSNPFIFFAVALAMAMHVGAMYFPPAQFVLRLEPLGPEVWARMTAVAASILLVVEVHKLLRRDR